MSAGVILNLIPSLITVPGSITTNILESKTQPDSSPYVFSVVNTNPLVQLQNIILYVFFNPLPPPSAPTTPSQSAAQWYANAMATMQVVGPADASPTPSTPIDMTGITGVYFSIPDLSPLSLPQDVTITLNVNIGTPTPPAIYTLLVSASFDTTPIFPDVELPNLGGGGLFFTVSPD